MADIYTIRLEDQVTTSAYRVSGALVDVSVAAQYLSRSIKQGDKDMIALDRSAMRAAQSELSAARAALTAGRAVAKLTPRMQQSTVATVKHTGMQREATTQSFRFSYALNALANQAVGLATALARRLATGLNDAASGLYDVANLASRAHLSFANFFGGQASGDKVLQETIEIAKRYGFTIEDVVAQMNRFGAAGFTAEQSKGTLRFGADMMAAGRSVQDVKGIFLAMTQIMGKGKLQAEELTQQLAERGINAGRVWQILGGILGKTVDEVMKLQKAGKIPAGLALNAIVQAGVEGVHGRQIGKAGEKVADATVGGLGRRMSTLIESEVFDAVDKASPALVKGMQSIFGGMNVSSAAGLKDNLTKGLENFGAILEKIGPQIPAMVDGFTKAFGAASGFNIAGWDGFAQSLPAVATNLGMIAGTLGRIAGLITQIIHPIDSMGANRERFLSFISGNGYKTAGDMGLTANEGSAANVTNTAENLKLRAEGDDLIAAKTGENFAAGLTQGILSGAPSVAKAAESIGDGAIDASQTALGVHSPSTKMKSQGAYMAEGLALGMDQNADVAMHSAMQMAEGSLAAGAAGGGLDSRRAVAAGSAAGEALGGGSSRTLTVKIGDLYFGGGAGSSGGGDAMTEARAYFETEFVAMLERQLEGVGA